MPPAGLPVHYSFRRLAAEAEATPGDGEVLFRLHVHDHATRGQSAAPLHLACDVLQRGQDALLFGRGTPRTLVLLIHGTRPSLDDMLAACFVCHGWTQPGLEVFARYAAVVRQGLPVTSMLPERSLEGIFLAIRNHQDLVLQDLEDAAVATLFVEQWRRLEQRILAAAEARRSPFNDRLFEDPAFAAERRFLAADRKTFGEDVRRGVRWRAQLPGGAGSASALILFEPKSLLFKHWSRYGSRCRYAFLGVRWRAGQWVFSTDPLECISLQDLAAHLQEAESAQPGTSMDETLVWGRPAASPARWFEGARFEHTLIASPHAGSRLSEERLLQIVQQWLDARALSETEGAPTDAFIDLWPFAALSKPRHSYWADQVPVFAAFDAHGTCLDAHIRGLDDSEQLSRRDIALARQDLQRLWERLDQAFDPRQARVSFCREIIPSLWIGRDLAALLYEHADLGSLATWRTELGSVSARDVLQIGADIAEALSYLHQLGIDDLELSRHSVVLRIEQGALRAAVLHAGFGAVLPTDTWAGDPRRQDPGRARDMQALGALCLYALTGAAEIMDVDRAIGAAACQNQLRDASTAFFAGMAELISQLLRSGDSCLSIEQARQRLEALAATLAADGAQATGVGASPVHELSAEPAPLATLYTPEIVGEVSVAQPASPAPGEMQGQELHGYRLQQELGRGAAGIVYQAEHVLLRKLVAIKILPPSCVDRANFKQRFCNEGMFLARLEHPHIIKVSDLFESQGLLCIVSELAAGGSLLRYLTAQGVLPEAEAASLARQCALGLHAAAQEGIVHRDVKPGNLLLTAQGVLKIADFGIARERGIPGPTIAGSILGTPHYSSPEQCLATSSADHRSDLYSLGCTLFELLTGRTPFSGRSAVEVIARHIQQAPPDPRVLRPELSEAVSGIVSRCLRKAPGERFQSGLQLAHALEALCQPGGHA